MSDERDPGGTVQGGNLSVIQLIELGMKPALEWPKGPHILSKLIVGGEYALVKGPQTCVSEGRCGDEVRWGRDSIGPSAEKAGL